MDDSSTRVVYAALAGNVLVALSKFGAALVSGSSAMLTEAVHSSADTVNQILLLIGNKRSRARPDPSHAFGYDGEIYFWAFVVAVMVLLAGGATSLYQGVAQLRAPEPISSPGLSLGVLALSALFEGSSLAVGYREYKRIIRTHQIAGERVSLWRFIILSKDPNLYESLLEDSAALIGIGLAAAGVLASAYLGWLWADGAASIAIGLLLIADSYVIAAATRSLIAGETVAPALRQDIELALRSTAQAHSIAGIATLHTGPRTILVVLTLILEPDKTVAQAKQDLGQLSERLKAVDPRIAHVFFQFK